MVTKKRRTKKKKKKRRCFREGFGGILGWDGLVTESNQQLSRFTAIFAGGTLLSRVLGLVRDMVIFAFLPKAAQNAFLFAFKFPNMLRDMFGEGAMNAVFVPIFAASHEKDSQEEYKRLVAATLSAVLILFLALTVVGVLLMPFLPALLEVLRTFTGKDLPDPGELKKMVRLVQWTFPYLFFIGLTAFAMGPLFVAKHYATPAWSPLLLNVALIASCLVLKDCFTNPAYALVVGVWVGGVAQLSVMYWQMHKRSGVLWPRFQLLHPGVRKAAWLLLPIVLGQATGEVNKLVDAFFAYSLQEVPALFAANRLVQLPLSIFGTGVAVAILPTLSRAAAKGDVRQLRTTLVDGLRRSAFAILPAMAGLMVLARPLVRLLFERGAFDAEAADHAAISLQYYAAGLLFFAWVKVMAQAFFATHNTKTPVIVASLSMLLNILLNCVLVGSMGYKGLALGTTLSYTANFVILLVLLYNRYGALWEGGAVGAFVRMVFATVIMACVTYGLNVKIEMSLGIESLGAKLMAVLIPVGVGVVLYGVLCRVFRIPEWEHFCKVFQKK